MKSRLKLTVLLLIASVSFCGCTTPKEKAAENFDKGYVQGQSDAIKRQYWLRQAMEREKAAATATDEGARTYYVLPGPEQTADGKKLEQHTVVVPVVQ